MGARGIQADRGVDAVGPTVGEGGGGAGARARGPVAAAGCGAVSQSGLASPPRAACCATPALGCTTVLRAAALVSESRLSLAIMPTRDSEVPAVSAKSAPRQTRTWHPSHYSGLQQRPARLAGRPGPR